LSISSMTRTCAPFTPSASPSSRRISSLPGDYAQLGVLPSECARTSRQNTPILSFSWNVRFRMGCVRYLVLDTCVLIVRSIDALRPALLAQIYRGVGIVFGHLSRHFGVAFSASLAWTMGVVYEQSNSNISKAYWYTHPCPITLPALSIPPGHLAS
jgi:hypothetical protein